MRAIVQRVLSASVVEVEGRAVSEIGPGLLVLVGIHDSDADSDADYMNRIPIPVLLWNGNDPIHLCPNLALDPGLAHSKCRKVLNMRLFSNEKTGKAWDQSVMQRQFGVLLDGIFGAMMKVNLVNDGPVTMQLDSSATQDSSKPKSAACEPMEEPER